MAAAKKSAAPKPKAHRRTADTERVVRALVKANAEVTHTIIAEALGIGVTTLVKHYADLIPHVGAGRPEHVPTKASRELVEQHKALGLKHVEIATLLDVSRDTLEKHYGRELSTGLIRTKGLVGSMIVARALSKSDKDAQRAGEFFMERMGGWVSKSKVGVGIDPGGDDDQPLVGGQRAIGRPDARKVALLLYSAARTQVVADVPVPESEEAKR